MSDREMCNVCHKRPAVGQLAIDVGRCRDCAIAALQRGFVEDDRLQYDATLHSSRQYNTLSFAERMRLAEMEKTVKSYLKDANLE